MPSTREIFSKDNLTLTAGIFSAGFINTWVFRNYGSKLPGFSSSPWVAVAYGLAIPVALAYAVRKQSPTFAKGVILGGLLTAVQSGYSLAMPATPVAATAAYLGRRTATRSLGYQGINAMSGPARSIPGVALSSGSAPYTGAFSR